MKKSLTLLSILFFMFSGLSFLTASTVNETEPNNSEGTANPISPVFSGNDSQDTIKASLNPDGETDYFSVTIPDGYYYTLDAEAFDSYNLNGGSYTIDVKIGYKIGSGDWSDYDDSDLTGIFVSGPATIYFKVVEYSSYQTTGTYALCIKAHKSVISYTSLSLDFVSDNAKDTTKTDISAIGEVDFYQVTLSAGYNYSIDVQLFDSYNTGGGSYSVDAKFSYKIGNGEWSGTYDSYKSGIITTPTTLYFMVQSYSSGYTGTYALYLNVNRKVGNYLSADHKSFYLSSLLQDTSLNVTCTGAWSASSNNAWLILNTTSGTGNGVLNYTIAANSSSDARNGSLTLTSAGADPVTIYVYQDPYIAPDIYEPNNSEDAYSILSLSAFENNHAVVSTNFNSNLHLRTDVDYYKFRLSSGYKYLVKLNLSDDDNTDIYSGDAFLYSKHANGSFLSYNNIFFCDGKDSVMLRAEYDGNVGTYKVSADITRFNGDLLQADQNYINLRKDARTYNYIYVYSTTSWTVETNQTWVTLGSTSGTGIDDFYFNVDANSGEARTATITLKATGLSDVVITVNQEGNNVLADKYETNDTEGTAYSIALTYTNDKASFSSTEANIHSTTDLDYYKVALPAGYNYIINSSLLDYYNYNSSSRYSLDGKYSYKVNSEDWSSTYDSQAGSIIANNGGTIYFKVQSYYSEDTGAYALQLNIERYIITGIANNKSEKSFNVYPNPSNGNFTLSMGEALNSDAKITITNLSGRVVYNSALGKGYVRNNINLNTNLPAGIYILQVVSDNNKMVKRIIIK